MKKFLGLAVASGVILALLAGPQAATAAARPSLRGRATIPEYSVTVNVRQTGSGNTAVGTFKIVDAGYDVTVDEMVTPSGGGNDYFCVSGTNSSGERANLYIRDFGDGRTTFDEVTYQGGSSDTCSDTPAFSWDTVTSGNFRGQS